MTKKTIQLFTALTTGACFAATAVSGQMIGVWNFNDDSAAPDSQLVPSAGSGTFDASDWPAGGLGNFVGTSINAFAGDPNGRDLAFLNGTVTGGVPANEGLSFTISVTVPALAANEFVQMSYAGRTTNTGMRDLTWSISTDGVSFDAFTLVDHAGLFGGGNYGLVTIDFDSIGFTGGDFYIRGTFETQVGQSTPTTAGNTRIDNLQIAVIPEPSTYAAIVGVLFLGLVLYRRRR